MSKKVEFEGQVYTLYTFQVIDNYGCVHFIDAVSSYEACRIARGIEPSWTGREGVTYIED